MNRNPKAIADVVARLSDPEAYVDACDEAAGLILELAVERDTARRIAEEQRKWIEQEMSDGAPLIGFPWEAP